MNEADRLALLYLLKNQSIILGALSTLIKIVPSEVPELITAGSNALMKCANQTTKIAENYEKMINVIYK